MKIVIDLDEKYYNDIKNSPTASNYSTLYALFGIRNGTLLSEELEKIKEKISKLTRYYTTENGHINLVSDNAVYRIIDKEIAELKGENNE